MPQPYPAADAAKRALAERGISQAEAARQLGVSRFTLNRVLNGRDYPWPRLRSGIAELVDQPVDKLFPAVAHRLARGG